MFLLFHRATNGCFLLFIVRDDIPNRCKAGDVNVSIVALAASEQLVCAMETVQNPKDPIVLVEPVKKQNKGYRMGHSKGPNFPAITNTTFIYPQG